MTRQLGWKPTILHCATYINFQHTCSHQSHIRRKNKKCIFICLKTCLKGILNVFCFSLNGDVLSRRKVSPLNRAACRNQESGQNQHHPIQIISKWLCFFLQRKPQQFVFLTNFMNLNMCYHNCLSLCNYMFALVKI